MTEIVFILDCSLSMKRLVSDVIGGFNSMIKKQQTETEGNALVSTVLFDHESNVLHDRVPLNDVKPLTQKDYEVRGTLLFWTLLAMLLSMSGTFTSTLVKKTFRKKLSLLSRPMEWKIPVSNSATEKSSGLSVNRKKKAGNSYFCGRR